MTHNIGWLDRLARLILGILILGLYGVLAPPGRYLTLLGLIPLGTALTGSCPVYTMLGVSTRRADST
jgi:hypothetical protein